MADNFTTLWNRLRLRAPAIDAALAQDLIRDSFQQLAERREWSWLMKHSAFYPLAFTITGTVSVTANYNLVTASTNVFTPLMTGSQIRIGGSGGTGNQTYTIIQYLTPTTVLIDSPWSGPTLSDQAYTIFQCYFPVPSDFGYFYSMVNTTGNYRLWTGITQELLDKYDPQRTQAGNPFAAAFYDYTQNYSGTISQPLQVIGTGPAPVTTSDTGLTFPVATTFSIKITTSGAVGTATFQWKQDSGDWSPDILSTAYPQNLAAGVQLYFPGTVSYVSGDIFVINCIALVSGGVPRFELWPRPINAQYVLPYQYIARLPELTDSAPQLPQMVAQRGDVVLEMALANCARWPGTDTARNPYYDLNLARQHEQRSQFLVNELEMKDDSMAAKDLVYQNMPYYPAPWQDGSWLQAHGPMY